MPGLWSLPCLLGSLDKAFLAVLRCRLISCPFEVSIFLKTGETVPNEKPPCAHIWLKMKTKGNEVKSEILAMSEKKLHKVTNMCGSLKKTRVIAKKPKKVDLNLKKIDLTKKEAKNCQKEIKKEKSTSK
ncbi:hypothetical protein BpHYR1_025387 [Brachionus plicatilis]|uniref:Uncharacterized protein n=1 Tax=Brachionus plicatilis TaxID=10195 RepID=A0A3M7PLQ0_BRAPC|nr:hypothetical protein BpHYR1_025387 [Brachionus plicatilis]